MDTQFFHDIPKLGFGLMRLPMNGNAIDVEQTKQMVDRFMDAGFRYFDTAYGYNNGESENAIRQALVERYPRESFYLATKLPAWAGPKTQAEAEQMFYTSLERTGAGYFDFYLLHNLGGERTKYFDDYDLWNFIQARKAEGLIRRVGFSMHDSAEALDAVLTAHPETEFVQLQINYADWESPKTQSRLCYETARKHGKPIVIMEPVKGGTLSSLPPKAAAPLQAIHPEQSISSWAIRFAASLDGILTVLSGMSNMEQMEDNIATMTDFQPLNESERAAIAETQAVLDSLSVNPCTGCNYCAEGCPQNIAISAAFEAMNYYAIYGTMAAARSVYSFPTKGLGKGTASMCIECAQCESVCPQGIAIIDELKKAAELLDT